MEIGMEGYCSKLTTAFPTFINRSPAVSTSCKTTNTNGGYRILTFIGPFLLKIQEDDGTKKDKIFIPNRSHLSTRGLDPRFPTFPGQKQP